MFYLKLKYSRVKLNGIDFAVIWTAPWSVDITTALKQKDNKLEIEIPNLWPNRLIGDEQLPDDEIQDGHWPQWILKCKPRPSHRFTFATYNYQKRSVAQVRAYWTAIIQQTDF